MTGILIRRYTTGEHHVKIEAETGMMLPEAMECWGLPEAGKDKEGSWPCENLDFGFLTSRRGRACISVVLRYLV